MILYCLDIEQNLTFGVHCSTTWAAIARLNLLFSTSGNAHGADDKEDGDVNEFFHLLTGFGFLG